MRFIGLYKDQELEDRFEMINNITFNGTIVAYRVLVKIYEKQKRYDEALEICKEAINQGDHDNTKSGYLGRIDRIKRKMNK